MCGAFFFDPNLMLDDLKSLKLKLQNLASPAEVEQRYHALVTYLGSGVADKESLTFLFDQFFSLGAFEDSIKVLDMLEAHTPSHPQLAVNRGAILRKLNRLEEAERTYLKGLQLHPQIDALRINLANLYVSQLRFIEAIALYQHARDFVIKKPALVLSYGRALTESRKLSEAGMLYEDAVKEHPESAELWTALGTTMRGMKRIADSLNAYREALNITPQSYVALNNVAVALRDTGKIAESVPYFSQAIKMAPTNGDIFYNRGNAYSDLRRFDEAERDYITAAQLKPTSAIYNNLGNLYKEVKKDAAVNAYTKAHELAPNLPRPLRNRATIQRELRNYKLAISDFLAAYKVDPSYEYLLGDLLHTKMIVNDWADYEAYISRLRQGLQRNEKLSSPFPVITLLDEPHLQRLCATQYGIDKFPANAVDAESSLGNLKYFDLKKVGLFSADFHNHATMHLMEGLIRGLSLKGIQLYAFSLGGRVKDNQQEKYEQLFHRFIDVHLMSDGEVAELARSEQLQIALDLKGYTQNCRPGIFANRAAPIQVNYLGYPGTTGLPYIDAIVADDFVISQGHEELYSERVYRMPGCYQPNTPKQTLPSEISREATPHEFPADAFVYASFNNNYKITPEMLDIWVEVVSERKNALLWILVDNSDAEENLKKECLARGLGEDRLHFAHRVASEAHLMRHTQAHVLLDTWPCSGHTTASDAIWMGLPIVTMPGNSFASRVCMSVLHEMECEEGVAESRTHYKQLALRMYDEPLFYEQYKMKLRRENVLERLYNIDKYTESFVSLLQTILREQPK
jgi:predicted O-linked N-acetylglucosamine transferase (SPINDLY family)